jgi:SUN domain-containing protein 1/2
MVANEDTQIPLLPSSDDDNQPALVRYDARSTLVNVQAVSDLSPPPEKWALKDTSVNVATTFHQATSAAPDMSHHNIAWASGSNRPNPSVPEAPPSSMNRKAPPSSRLNNSTGAGLRTIPAQSTRRPVSKPASVHHSEAEAENDADINGVAKRPSDQIIDVAKVLATFYLHQRSQEPVVSADVSNPDGQNSSWRRNTDSRLTAQTLPIMSADKRKRRRTRGGKSGTGNEGDDSEIQNTQVFYSYSYQAMNRARLTTNWRSFFNQGVRHSELPPS